MKKIYMTMVALLCGVAAMAQNTVLVPEKIEVAAGSTADITVGFDVSADPNIWLAAFAFRIGLPEGCTLTTHTEQKFVPGQGMVATEVFDNEIFNGQGHTASIQAVGDATPEDAEDAAAGFMQCAVTVNPVNVFVTQTGDIVKLSFMCPESAKSGTYDIVIKKISGSTWDAVNVPFENVTVPLEITGGTGINSINADNANAPVYNLAGQRVSKAQNGVFIQSGKKVAVK